MNFLSVGADKSPLISKIPNRRFLLIDDGPIIDTITVPARVFDPKRHSFNPVPKSYLEDQEFIEVLSGLFPEGDSTLTKANAHYQILESLHDRPRALQGLVEDSKDTRAAFQKIERLYLSPVLSRVFTGKEKFSLTGTILARIDRAEIGNFDAFVLGTLLISKFPGTVIVPDFGFYAIPAHDRLIRQNRLIAGVNSFDEVPKLKHQLMQIPEKVGKRCTPDDAEILANYCGFPRGSNGYNAFIEECLA